MPDGKTIKMTQKLSIIAIAILAIITGLYPGIYLFMDRQFGLLSSKSNALLENTFWNLAFYTHIFLGGIALLIGWIQFNSKLRLRNLSAHRTIGKIYTACVIPSSIASIGLAIFATGGLIPSLGFSCLGIIWLTTTLFAYLNIKNRRIDQHRKLMIYSYAACFAAVTLRLWLPLLTSIFNDFIIAYSIVAWLCWVPNLLVARFIVKNLGPHRT